MARDRMVRDVRTVARLVLAAERELQHLPGPERYASVRAAAVAECGARCLRWLRPVVEAVLAVVEVIALDS